jgi:hypothetical protein
MSSTAKGKDGEMMKEENLFQSQLRSDKMRNRDRLPRIRIVQLQLHIYPCRTVVPMSGDIGR